MRNAEIKNLPNRPEKQRTSGQTMVIDKGLGLNQAIDMVEIAGEYIDFVKLGFGTSIISGKLKEKIELYKKHNIIPYFGGTMFEAFYIRKQLNEFIDYVNKFEIELIEISDGAMDINHDEKCELIQRLSLNQNVISEVGSKDASKEIPINQWIEMMNKELNAGSLKVIAEARESGNLGVFNTSGNPKQEMIDALNNEVGSENILWEAPAKSQQVWFIKNFGPNVNLGNIAPTDVLSLETIRLGLRGDTFTSFL